MKKQIILLLAMLFCAELVFAEPIPRSKSPRKPAKTTSDINTMFPLNQKNSNGKSPAEMAKEELKKSMRQSEDQSN